MSPALSSLGPLFLSVGLVALLVQFGRGQGGLVRALFSALCIALAARYVWWRFEYSIPANQNIYQQAWAWMFFAFETMSICSSTSVILFMSRPGGRTPPAQIPPQIANAPINVFIATYNEPYNIIERTIVGAKAINHPDVRVWILDDGARDWVRELADDLGIHYVRRVKGAHAKAGNINNGLRQALSAGRRPEFILILDADFVPYRNILKRTLGLFSEPDVGIVQTPQHFFNPDPNSEQPCADPRLAGRATLLLQHIARLQGRLGRRLLLRNIGGVSRRCARRRGRDGDRNGDRGYAHLLQIR